MPRPLKMVCVVCAALLLGTSAARAGQFISIDVNKTNQKERSKEYFSIETKREKDDSIAFRVRVKQNPADKNVSTSLARLEMNEGDKRVAYVPLDRPAARAGEDHSILFFLSPKLAVKTTLVLVQLTFDASGNVYRIDLGSYIEELAIAAPDAAAARPAAPAAKPADKDAGLLFSESFEDTQLLKRGWYDGDRFTIADKQPFAGKGAIEYAWQAGGTTPGSSSGVRHLFEPTEVVYLRCYIRLSKGWGWTGKPFHPHLMHFMTTENHKFHGPAASRLTVYIEPWNGRLRLAAQDIQNKDAKHGLTQGPLRGGYNGKLYDSRDVLFNDDGWHCVEAMFQLNTLDLKADKPNADGIVRAWFDGRLVIDHADVVLRSTDFPKMKFNQFLLTPYFGPGLLPQAQTLWIDELAVGTKRVGL